MGYSWGLGQYEVAAFGRNILNEIEAVGGIDFHNRTGFINEPRTVGVEFSWAARLVFAPQELLF